MKRHAPYIPSAQGLARAALQYLERYAASEAQLRRVLENRLRRAALRNPDFDSNQELKRTLRSAIETIIESHKKSGAICDTTFAETKVNSLRRQGRSRRAIQQKLAVAGIERSLVGSALEHVADGLAPEEAEYKAALALVRRRKLGPFRLTPSDDERRRKDFAALARAGFSSVIARRVLKSETPEDWD